MATLRLREANWDQRVSLGLRLRLRTKYTIPETGRRAVLPCVHMQARAEARTIDGQTPLSPGPASLTAITQRHDAEIIRFRLPRPSPRSSSDTPIPSAAATRHFFIADFSRFPNTRLAPAGSDRRGVPRSLF